MKIVICGAYCDITEKTALAVFYPHKPWCKTLAEAKAEEEAENRILAQLDEIDDYDIYSDVYKSIYGIRPRWVSREEIESRRKA